MDQKFTWYLAIAYALANSKVRLEDLKDYKKNYREGSKYQSYLVKNPEHSRQLNDIIMRIKGDGYFEKLDREQVQTKKQSKIENQFKKVRFY